MQKFAKQNIIFLYDPINAENEFKTWDEMKISDHLNGKSYLKSRQIVNSIPKTWKKVLKKIQNDRSNLVLLDHQLLKNNLTLSIDKINSKQTYPIIISSKVNIPTCRNCFEKRFLLYTVTIKAYLRLFQYKIINNVLYHKKKIHTLSLSNTQLCFFCKWKKRQYVTY